MCWGWFLVGRLVVSYSGGRGLRGLGGPSQFVFDKRSKRAGRVRHIIYKYFSPLDDLLCYVKEKISLILRRSGFLSRQNTFACPVSHDMHFPIKSLNARSVLQIVSLYSSSQGPYNRMLRNPACTNHGSEKPNPRWPLLNTSAIFRKTSTFNQTR